MLHRLDRLVLDLARRVRRGGRPHEHHGGRHHDRMGDGRFAGEEARRYERKALARRRAFRSAARELAGLVPEGGHVLDVGTGPALLLRELARLRPEVRGTGVDVEPSFLVLAREAAAAEGLTGRLGFVLGDARALPLATASVDVAAATLTAHHWPDLAAGVGELVRVVRPGGAILVEDFRAEVDGPLRAALAEHAPGARARRTRTWIWMWGLPLLSRWVVHLP